MSTRKRSPSADSTEAKRPKPTSDDDVTAEPEKSTMLAVNFDVNSEDLASIIKVKEIAKPTEIPAGHVLVKVAAAAMNPVDLYTAYGAIKGFGWSMPLPFTMGYDFSGVVAEVGEGASFAVGDEVWAVNWGEGTHDSKPVTGGAFAEYILMDSKKVSKKAASVSHEEAAAVALVGTTGYQALGKAGVHSGDSKKILILGGSSAVGHLAIQIAKKAGCWVATTCSSRTKEYVESVGAADLIIDYNKDKWEEMEEIKGIDAIFDSVGEKEALERAKLTLRSDGYFVTIVSHDIGFDAAAHAPLKHAASMVLSNDAEVQDKLMTMLAAGDLKVSVEKTFPFTTEGVLEMVETQKAGKSKGKNVLKM